MDPAVAAESLILHKRAFLTAQSGIVKKLLTFRAQLSLLSVGSLMILPAVQTDHFSHHILLFSPLFFDIFHHFCLLPLYLCLLQSLHSPANACTCRRVSLLPGLLRISPLYLRRVSPSGRNRAYLCKEIHIFEQDQKKDKCPSVHILHCQKCQDQHTGSRNEQTEFCLQSHRAVLHETLQMFFI